MIKKRTLTFTANDNDNHTLTPTHNNNHAKLSPLSVKAAIFISCAPLERIQNHSWTLHHICYTWLGVLIAYLQLSKQLVSTNNIDISCNLSSFVVVARQSPIFDSKINIYGQPCLTDTKLFNWSR